MYVSRHLHIEKDKIVCARLCPAILLFYKVSTCVWNANDFASGNNCYKGISDYSIYLFCAKGEMMVFHVWSIKRGRTADIGIYDI